jgi:hypothetical protein
MRMKSVDCGLGETATISGLGAFLFAVRAASAPTGLLPGRALPVVIRCLIAGLFTASFVTWRDRWR